MYLLEQDALEEFQGVSAQDGPLNAVVVGLAPSKFNYETLTEAFRLIKEKNARFIAVHESKYFKTETGLALGPGAFVKGLEYSSGKTAEVVGKPEKAFFEAALDSLNEDFGLDVRLEETLMIGDDAQIDALGAKNAGLLNGCPVKTGKYLNGDEEKCRGCIVKSNILEIVSEVLE